MFICEACSREKLTKQGKECFSPSSMGACEICGERDHCRDVKSGLDWAWKEKIKRAAADKPMSKRLPLGVLYAVRQRLGADKEEDEGFDPEIDKMTPERVVKLYCGWVLGDEALGTEILGVYKAAKGE